MSKKIMEQTLIQNTKRFFKPAFLRKKENIKYIIQQVIIACSSLLGIIFLERIISALSDSNKEQFLLMLLLYTFLLVLFEVLLFLMRKWGWMNTLPYNIVDIYDEYLGKYLIMDNNKIELLGTGKTIGIVSDGAKVWSSLISECIEKIISLGVTIGFTIYMISRVSFWYVLIFVGLIFVSFLLIAYVNKLQAVFRSRRYEYRNIRMKQFVKVVMARIEVLQSGNFSKEVENMYKNTDKICQVSKDMATYRIILKRSASFLVSLVLIGLFFTLGNDILSGELEIGILVGISGTLIIMQRSITDAMNFYIDFSKDFISVEKLWNFFDTTPQIEGYETGNTFKHKTGTIELKQVNYGYTPENPIFKNFSLNIPGNQVTALVGPSGGGKSTLVKLISGYIRQDSGDILVDSQNLKETSLKSYYKDIGYLTQEPSVFDGTVRENLEYGMNNAASFPGERERIQDRVVVGEKKESRDQNLKEIIKLAHCEFIYDLPNGLDTEIGERGVKLSGGQKQRLAIAKIFLKDPKIIILDEPTSALDSLSEKKITEAMHNLFKNRTVIVIAHRLQTVKHADDIIVIQSGKVLERGKHEELVKKDGFYKEMLDLQSGF